MNDLLLLSMMLDGPKYGYQLKREAGWIMGQALHNNLVYPSLRRFLEEGWVRRKAVPGQRGQTRQQYALSPEGKLHLSTQLNEFSQADAASEAAFNLRVGLFPVLRPETRENILSLREQWLRDRHQKLTGLRAKMDLGQFGGDIVRHMRKQIKMELDWVQLLRRKIRTMEGWRASL